MRKILAIAAVVLLPLAGSNAWAAIAGTAHSSGFTLAQSGDCSICHIPHAARGGRLWPSPPAVPADANDKISPFCGYCHLSTGGNYMIRARSDSSVWNLSAHGFGTTTNPDANAQNTATLPYSGPTVTGIQCTTCHNVHDDTNRPFLRVDPDALCHLCHPSRGNASGTWAGYGAGNTIGSHPVGLNVGVDIGADTPILATPLGIRDYGTWGDYRLGPKVTNGAAGLSATTGMVCNSCHSVHGVETADGGTVAVGTPNEDLLAIPQTSFSGSANGAQNIDPRNALCEACHYSTAATADAKGVAYVGSFRPNPGATAYTHPADNLAANLNWVTTMPTQWPWTTSVNATVGVNVLCESCHMPHPAASTVAQAGRAATVTTGTPILRDSMTTICNRCHSSSVANHHPASLAANQMGRYVDAAIAGTDGDATNVSCSDCHAAAGAHNWAVPAQGSATVPGGLALNAAWEPANNLRGAADAAGQANAAMSKECIDCHVTVGDTGRLRAPTNNAANNNAVITPTGGSTEYQDSGDGTHWIGANGGAGNGVTYADGRIQATVFNATTTAWPSTGTSANHSQGGWSRWGAAAGAAVCESCHELEPDRNVPQFPAGTGNFSSLLLYWYTDGGASADANRGVPNATSVFCTGCHGATPGGGSPHPMTGGTITKVVDSGIGADGLARGTNTLLTSNGGFAANASSYMNQTGAIITASQVTLPALNAMNCDSCHQVHDAPSPTGSWIVDTPSTSVSGGLGANFGSSPASANYQTFCIECHSY